MIEESNFRRNTEVLVSASPEKLADGLKSGSEDFRPGSIFILERSSIPRDNKGLREILRDLAENFPFEVEVIRTERDCYFAIGGKDMVLDSKTTEKLMGDEKRAWVVHTHPRLTPPSLPDFFIAATLASKGLEVDCEVITASERFMYKAAGDPQKFWKDIEKRALLEAISEGVLSRAEAVDELGLGALTFERSAAKEEELAARFGEILAKLKSCPLSELELSDKEVLVGVGGLFSNTYTKQLEQVGFEMRCGQKATTMETIRAVERALRAGLITADQIIGLITSEVKFRRLVCERMREKAKLGRELARKMTGKTVFLKKDAALITGLAAGFYQRSIDCLDELGYLNKVLLQQTQVKTIEEFKQRSTATLVTEL